MTYNSTRIGTCWTQISLKGSWGRTIHPRRPSAIGACQSDFSNGLEGLLKDAVTQLASPQTLTEHPSVQGYFVQGHC